MCDCLNENYCNKCFTNKNLELKECHCNKGYFAFFKKDDQIYCSKCFLEKGGKSSLISKSNCYSEDNENEIIKILKITSNYSPLIIKEIILRTKNSNSEKEIYNIINEFDKSNIFLTSKESALILKNITFKFNIKKPHIYQNIICCKVIDFWNMTKVGHGVGACYFDNQGAKPKTINEAIQILNRNKVMLSTNFSNLKYASSLL